MALMKQWDGAAWVEVAVGVAYLVAQSLLTTERSAVVFSY